MPLLEPFFPKGRWSRLKQSALSPPFLPIKSSFHATPQSSLLIARWDAAQFASHWIKPIRILNLLSSILCLNRFSDGDGIRRKHLRTTRDTGKNTSSASSFPPLQGPWVSSPRFWSLLFASGPWSNLIGYPVPHLIGTTSSMLGAAGGLVCGSPSVWNPPPDSMLGVAGGSCGSPFFGVCWFSPSPSPWFHVGNCWCVRSLPWPGCSDISWLLLVC